MLYKNNMDPDRDEILFYFNRDLENNSNIDINIFNKRFNFGTFILSMDECFWSKNNDQHDHIIKEFNLVEKNNGENILTRAYIEPDYNINNLNNFYKIENWKYSVDYWFYNSDYISPKESLPSWYIDDSAEKRCRDIITEWFYQKIYYNKNAEIFNKHAYVCGNSKIIAKDCFLEARDNSIVEAYGNSYIEAVHNSTIICHDNTCVVTRGENNIEAHDNCYIMGDGFGKKALFDYSKENFWDIEDQ